MKLKHFFNGVLCVSNILCLGTAHAAIPVPPDMRAVATNEQSKVPFIEAQNTLRVDMSTHIDFDYADINPSEIPIMLAEIDDEYNTASTSETDEPPPANDEQAAGGGYTEAEINEMINNPLGKLWMLMIQNDYISYEGSAVKNRIGQNTTLIQPVMPFQLTDNWKVIFRPVIPINSFETVESISINVPGSGPPYDRNDFETELQRENGLGDIVLWTAFATNEMAKPPNVFGFGLTTMLDTAAEKELGTGQNSLGPMALAFHIDDKWIYGTVVQHWWSVNEDSKRDDISLTDIQYVGRYRYSKDTNIGFSPNIRYNWEADSGSRWTIPVGIGADTMIKMGPLPVKIGLEVYHYVEQPDQYGPEWQIRLFFVPVIPSPGWTQKALF